MSPKKRRNTNLEERLWIISHNEKHKNISSDRIAKDFVTHFNRPIASRTVRFILKTSSKIKNIAATCPSLSPAKIQRVNSSVGFDFDADLAQRLEECYTRCNITYDIINIVGTELQQDPKYANDPQIVGLKFSTTYVNNFIKKIQFQDTFKIILQ